MAPENFSRCLMVTLRPFLIDCEHPKLLRVSLYTDSTGFTPSRSSRKASSFVLLSGTLPACTVVVGGALTVVGTPASG